MIIFSSIGLGILASFIASIIFTYMFTRFKPNIEISDTIAHHNGSFYIKVINRSQYSVINVKADLSYISHFNVPGGQERQSLKIPMTKKDELFEIEHFDRDSEYATYSYRYVTSADIRHGLAQNNRQYIRFKISVTHSLSNLGKVFQKEYYAGNIIDGDFPFGQNLEIQELIDE